MAADRALIALNRFGFGPRPGLIETVARHPRLWVSKQLQDPVGLPGPVRGGPDSATLIRQWYNGNRGQARQRMEAAERQGGGDRVLACADGPTPFFERLVHFWSNHFAVSVQNPRVEGLAFNYEREAIRPHILGRFRDMLGAVVRHPAMLLYLDNVSSVGPNSLVGQRRGRGLNENLAREILELHTLGVDGGYDQADVREFAKILTGWNIARNPSGPDDLFRYRGRLHEPGRKRLLGDSYGGDGDPKGREEGERALDRLARHPATARFVATKMARHFLADEPSTLTVNNLARTFERSEGDLGEMAQALVNDPGAWQSKATKVKSHKDLLISMLGASGVRPAATRIWAMLDEVGQRPFAAPSPQGWPDTARDWIAAEALLRRIEMGRAVAEQASRRIVPMALAERLVGDRLSARTRRVIVSAADPVQAVTLLFASPEFQRR